MIVFISDLHIGDHSVSNFNLGPAAFTGMFEDLAHHARNANARELRLVLLGDVFELIQTDFWSTIKNPDELPWGKAPDPEHPRLALEKAISANREIFSLFQGNFTRHFPGLQRAYVTYIPGNHDRIVNLYPALRRKVTQTLGLKRPHPEAAFPCRLYDWKHRVFARHGHESDVWNYPGRHRLDAAAHLGIPIGEVITTMLVSRLPGEVCKRLSYLPDETRQQIHDNLGAMFDVRPLAALIKWLSHHVRSFDDPDVRAEVDKAIRQTAREFNEIPFVRRWIKANWGGAGPLLWVLMFLLQRVSIMQLGNSRGLIERLASLNPSSSDDKYVKAALRDLTWLRRQPRTRNAWYIVYGHTHSPAQVPLQYLGTSDGAIEAFYFNSGTFRPRYDETVDKSGFVASKGLTYTIIYSLEEQRNRASAAMAEAWTGMLKDTDI